MRFAVCKQSPRERYPTNKLRTTRKSGIHYLVELHLVLSFPQSIPCILFIPHHYKRLYDTTHVSQTNKNSVYVTAWYMRFAVCKQSPRERYPTNKLRTTRKSGIHYSVELHLVLSFPQSIPCILFIPHHYKRLYDTTHVSQTNKNSVYVTAWYMRFAVCKQSPRERYPTNKLRPCMQFCAIDLNMALQP